MQTVHSLPRRRGWYRREHKLKLKVRGYSCTVFPRWQINRWQAHCYRLENRDRLWSKHYKSEEEARIVAHGLLVAFREWYGRRGQGMSTRRRNQRLSICERGTKLSISIVWVLAISMASSSSPETTRYSPLATS
jgi:hypothetical protein